MKCLHCNDSKYVIKAGLRNTRQGTIQKYYCKTCGKYFTDKTQPHSQYPLHVILYTVESYNKGYTVKQAKKLTGKKYRYSPPTRTIYSWINRYQDILNMLKLRKKYNLDPEELLKTYRFQHQQIYPFTYHNLKLNLYSKKLPQLRRYINWIKRSLPTKIFLNGPRASSTEFKHNKKTKQKKSNITELTKLALTTSQKNKSAHGTIEQFFLINDSNTICTELPVFINPDETDIIKLDLPLTGHIAVSYTHLTLPTN